MRKQTLEKFIKKFDRQYEAAEALGVHPSAISQALADIEAGKRKVFVVSNPDGVVMEAISVKPFGQ